MENSQILQFTDDLASLIPRFHQTFINQLDFPIPPNHFFIIVCLYDFGTQTITTISKRLLISKQQMSPIIEKLLNSGYIERHTDPADRRTAKISLTPQGLQILENHNIAMKKLLAKKIVNLTETELAEFNQVLVSFFRLFNKLT